MDGIIMLMCTYGLYTAAIRCCPGLTYAQLVTYVCEKWNNLSPDVTSLFYKIPGYNKCHIDSDQELDNMLVLAKSFRIEHIDVIVEVRDVLGCGNGVCVAGSHHTDTHNSQSGGRLSQVQSFEEGTDPLSQFCPTTEKVLMSAAWAHGITHVGQCFEGGAAEFRTVLSKYAIECGFHFKYVKNDLERVTAVCMLRQSKGCTWYIHARVQPANGFFYLKRWNDLHSCGVAVRTSKNPRINSEIVSNVIVDRVRDKPLTRPADVVYDLKKDYGLDVTYRVAWLGVEKARGEVYGDHSFSFDQLRWYSDTVTQYNPGSYINLDYDQDSGRFLRFFISFRACMDGFNHCRPLLFLDGTFLKGRFKGNLLAATGKDGNQGLFPLAFAIVDSENATNWSWFLQNLANIVDSTRHLTFVSDRNAGLLEAMPNVFPTAHHAFCLQHLQANLRDRLKGVPNGAREGILRKLRDCAYAPTISSFQLCMEKLKQSRCAGVQDFLKDLHPQHWANAYFRGQRYGEMWSNAAESFNNWIRDARHLPITRLVDTIRAQIMRQRAERRGLAITWNEGICPTMETRLETAFNIGRSWIVSQANDDVYEVHSFPSVLVDIGRRTCSCYKWQINGFPCAHAVAAIQRSGREVNECVEPHFHVSTYRASYAAAIYPIPTVEKPASVANQRIIFPPAVKRPPGRPKKKRIPSRGEKLTQIRCGRCGRMGNHNKKSCKEPIN